MKKSISILVLSLVLLLAFEINVQAQSKEVTGSATTTYYSTGKILPLGEGRFHMDYEAFGITLDDTGAGPFHNATSRNLGGMTIEKGIYKDERGWGVFNLQNGDKVFFTYTMAGQITPKGIGVATGTGTYTGGTGKFAGIQGGFEMTRYVLRTTVEGVGQSYTKSKTKFTLP